MPETLIFLLQKSPLKSGLFYLFVEWKHKNKCNDFIKALITTEIIIRVI